jgi:hypothetical protein
MRLSIHLHKCQRVTQAKKLGEKKEGDRKATTKAWSASTMQGLVGLGVYQRWVAAGSWFMIGEVPLT